MRCSILHVMEMTMALDKNQVIINYLDSYKFKGDVQLVVHMCRRGPSPRCKHCDCPNLTYFKLLYIESPFSIHLLTYSKSKQCSKYFDILSYLQFVYLIYQTCLLIKLSAYLTLTMSASFQDPLMNTNYLYTPYVGAYRNHA